MVDIFENRLLYNMINSFEFFLVDSKMYEDFMKVIQLGKRIRNNFVSQNAKDFANFYWVQDIICQYSIDYNFCKEVDFYNPVGLVALQEHSLLGMLFCYCENLLFLLRQIVSRIYNKYGSGREFGIVHRAVYYEGISEELIYILKCIYICVDRKETIVLETLLLKRNGK